MAAVFTGSIPSYNNHVSELLLPTKLFMPPLRPSLVARPRLVDRLEQERNAKLTLVSAPAGFGKTTLVVDWLSRLPEERPIARSPAHQLTRSQSAWLSLDENDNLFPRFFTYFITATQTIYPDLAQGLLSSLRMSPPVDDEAILPVLLHELAALERPLLMVLDDYHVITNNAIHEAISKLIDFTPPSLHLVITSREEPPLPLPRWRVRGQLTEIRAADLRFTVEEAAAFLQQTMGLELDDRAVAALEDRTEGWVAGLQLAALSLHGEADSESFIADFGGSSRHVADYLLEEVLLHQTPEVQAFLLQTSILERFNAELGDFLFAGEDAAPENKGLTGSEAMASSRSVTILEQLEQTNLFLIPLDAHRRWYRYHHLFAQLLQDRLRQEQGQAVMDQLRRRASLWFEIQGLTEEAVEYALQGRDFDGAARLLAAVPTFSLWDQGNTSLFKRWGRSIPTDSLLRFPRSLIAIAAAHLITGEFHLFENYLTLCEGIASIHGEYTLLKCMLVRNEGDFGQALHLAKEAGEFLAEGETTLRAAALIQIVNNLLRLGDLDRAERVIRQARELIIKAGEPNLNVHLQVIQLQGFVSLLRADLYQAQRLYHEGLALAEAVESGPPPMIGIMYAEMGRVHYEWNELAESTANFAEARTWADRTGLSDILVAALIGNVQLFCQQGDAAAVEGQLDILREKVSQIHLQDMIDQMDSLIALYYLRLGKLDKSILWADGSAFQLTDRPDGTQRYFYQIFVAVRLAECRALGIKESLAQMSSLLQYLFEQAMAGQYRQDMIEILILQALVLDYSGEKAAARQALQRALDLAQPGGLVRTFVDAGPALAPLLAQLDGPYARRLSQAFRQEAQVRAKNGPAVGALNLTPREFEILSEIAAGLSNKEIEEKLVISRNTVRSHIKNLYGKLGVSSRTQAILKARELNLL